jgi:hypothetical protein
MLEDFDSCPAPTKSPKGWKTGTNRLPTRSLHSPRELFVSGFSGAIEGVSRLGTPDAVFGACVHLSDSGQGLKNSIVRVWSRAELPSDLTWGRDPDVGGRLAPPTPRAALATYPGAQGPYSFFRRPHCGRNIGKTEEYPQDKSGERWIVRRQSWPPQVHPRDFLVKRSRLSDLALIVHTLRTLKIQQNRPSPSTVGPSQARGGRISCPWPLGPLRWTHR